MCGGRLVALKVCAETMQGPELRRESESDADAKKVSKSFTYIHTCHISLNDTSDKLDCLSTMTFLTDLTRL